MAAFFDPFLAQNHIFLGNKACTYQFERCPFEKFDDQEFYKRFRFNKASVTELCDILKPDLERKSKRNHPLSVESQVLTALRFYASGSYQQTTGDCEGFSQPSVSRSVTAISKSICKRLLNNLIKIPTGAEATRQKQLFYDVARFPGVILCIDGTHIRILAPSKNEEQFVNRKGYHLINVQAACDANYMFTNVFVKWPGSSHDASILRNSEFWTSFEDDPTQGIVLGDSAYPSRYWLLTPILNERSPADRIYNQAHMKTRCRIENSFGQLKRRFGVLHQENRRRLSNLLFDIPAIFTLHNFAKLHHQPDDFPDIPAEERNQFEVPNDPAIENQNEAVIGKKKM